jgi:hypothetical protein
MDSPTELKDARSNPSVVTISGLCYDYGDIPIHETLRVKHTSSLLYEERHIFVIHSRL